MSCYSFHIFDRHTDCIYSKRWTQPPQQRPMAALGSQDANNSIPSAARRALKAEDDAKLIFGTIFSLRRMVRQLGGQDDQFLCYRTGEYKLHYFETPTQLKFVMLTDTRVGNMRTVLYQIWATLYVEYVVKSPLAPTEHPKGVGVANELFEGGLESFIVRLVSLPPVFALLIPLGIFVHASAVSCVSYVAQSPRRALCTCSSLILQGPEADASDWQ